MAGLVAASSGGVVVAYLIFLVIYYVVMAVSLRKLAARTGTSQAWMAWVPILNLFLYVRVAGRSGWEGILLFVPFVNIVYGIAVAIWLPRRVGRSGWWAIPLSIPVVNLGALSYIAFSETYTAAV